MNINVFYGILIPFIGTSAGAACVFFMKRNLNEQVQRALTGFAAGVMVAAAVWSLTLPAFEAADPGYKGALVVTAGFLLGCAGMLLLDKLVPHQHMDKDKPEGHASHISRPMLCCAAAYAEITYYYFVDGMCAGAFFIACHSIRIVGRI